MRQTDLISDADLVRNYQHGDVKAFDILVTRYRRQLASYLQRMVSDPGAADDLFQDTFFKVIKALPRYKEQGKFSSWLFGIANRLAIDYLRKHKRQTKIMEPVSQENNGMPSPDILDTHSPSPEEDVKQRELQSYLKKAIKRLPVEQRQVLLLREHSGLSFKEIAVMLDCPINTVLGRMRYALLNLRKMATNDFGELDNVL